MKTYRDKGAIGALLDEYEKAIQELQAVIRDVSPEALTTIVDSATSDPDCRSIQTILAHVVRSGYGYAIYVRNHLGEPVPFRKRQYLTTAAAFCDALSAMFAYNVQLFDDYPTIVLEEYDVRKKMVVTWGQVYDVEQIMEHAIVHILRHRRQIERFLLRLENS